MSKRYAQEDAGENGFDVLDGGDVHKVGTYDRCTYSAYDSTGNLTLSLRDKISLCVLKYFLNCKFHVYYCHETHISRSIYFLEGYKLKITMIWVLVIFFLQFVWSADDQTWSKFFFQLEKNQHQTKISNYSTWKKHEGSLQRHKQIA